MFRPVKVFDYAQTDGKPLPERVASPVANLTGSVENYEAFMEVLRRSSPVPVEVKPLSADVDGYFSPKSQSITLPVRLATGLATRSGRGFPSVWA